MHGYIGFSMLQVWQVGKKMYFCSMDRPSFPHIRLPRTARWLLAGAAAVLLLWLWLFPLPGAHGRLGRSVVWLDVDYAYGLTDGQGDTLYVQGLQGDTLLLQPVLDRALAEVHRTGMGCWYRRNAFLPWGRGVLATTRWVAPPVGVEERLRRQAPSLLRREAVRVARRIGLMEQDSAHLQYYMNTHTVADEGYNQVGEYETRFLDAYDNALKLQERLQALVRAARVEAFLLVRCTAKAVRGDSLSAWQDSCRLVAVDQGSGWAWWQACGGRKPSWARYQWKSLWHALRWAGQDRRVRVAMCSFATSLVADSAYTVPRLSPVGGVAWQETDKGEVQTTLPMLNQTEGAPVLDRWGNLVGLASGKEILPVR